jgi:hypothetical protein
MTIQPNPWVGLKACFYYPWEANTTVNRKAIHSHLASRYPILTQRLYSWNAEKAPPHQVMWRGAHVLVITHDSASPGKWSSLCYPTWQSYLTNLYPLFWVPGSDKHTETTRRKVVKLPITSIEDLSVLQLLSTFFIHLTYALALPIFCLSSLLIRWATRCLWVASTSTNTQKRWYEIGYEVTSLFVLTIWRKKGSRTPQSSDYATPPPITFTSVEGKFAKTFHK